MLLSAGLLWLAVAGGSAGHAKPDADARDQRVMVVTTDSRAYCETLSAAIAAHKTLPREASELEVQGRELCNEGRVRGGIVRLRRALLMVHKGPAAGGTLPP